jgi:tetratricopeptide (TPR) repeat protein
MLEKTRPMSVRNMIRLTRRLYVFIVPTVVLSILMSGCSHFQSNGVFKEANFFFNEGDYQASLKKYEHIIERYPPAEDRALFEMGIIYAHPRNEQRDYEKSLECFQKLIRDHPRSEYRQDSEMMVFQIHNVTLKDRMIASQQLQVENFQREVITLQKKIFELEREIKNRDNEILALQKEVFELRKIPADKILIEKKERRLTLLANGRVIKTFKIALGGNPEGPKERLGDNKTPEGTYIIDARNKDSDYHLSLHISYPNEQDRKRAKALGVSPGGDIMIHGIKNGFSWAGGLHSEVDWTKGCIAVTDEEIEEIDKLVPIGTTVEIRP